MTRISRIEGPPAKFITMIVQGAEQENVMKPTISVCRKGDNLFLTLEGDFNHVSSQQLFQALRKLVGTSLKCFAADSPVAFSFRTHGKVDPKKTRYI